MKHKVFISYHHANDQSYKDELVRFAKENDIFIDGSVNTGDISDDMPDEGIREKIRDEYLRGTTVTILLVGKETKYRKHIDWEIYSSMYDGKINKKSGIIVIYLPSVEGHIRSGHGAKEKNTVFPEIESWTSIDSREKHRDRHPYLPERIIDNLLSDSHISIINWPDLTAGKLRDLVQYAYEDREKAEYDLSRPMRRRNN